MEKIVRFPRPMGTTAMMEEYHRTKDTQILDKAKNYLINQWLMGNGVLCGMAYDINTFSQKLGIDINYIRIYMRDRVLMNNLWTKENQDKMLESLLGEQLAWALEDRMEVSHQVNILRESQQGKYTPFISAELNKALKLKLESSTSLQSIIRNLTGGNTTNIFTQINNNQQIPEQVGISQEEARKIILETTGEDTSESARYLETKYDMEALPEVVATKQEGVDVSKEGLSFSKTELDLITDDYKGAMALTSQEHHEMRREIEMRIDPDEPDPELDLYEDIDPIQEEEKPFTNQFLKQSHL